MPDFKPDTFKQQYIDDTHDVFVELRRELLRWEKLVDRGACPTPVTLRNKKPKAAARALRSVLADLRTKLDLVEADQYNYRTPEQRMAGKEKSRAKR